RAANMRLPRFKQPTAYAKPDVLERPRLGISSSTRALVGAGAEDREKPAGDTERPAQGGATALTELEHLREAALVEIGPPPLDAPRRLRMDVGCPPVALLVAAYNEEESIAETLDYALRSDYPGAFEIVVADDGSRDRTREIVEEYAQRDERVRLLEVDHGGKAEALNAALREVRTPLVATIDADTLLMPYSLRRAVARLANSPEDTVAVAGAVLGRNSRENLLTRAQEWDYFLGIASVKRAQSLLQGPVVAQGAVRVYVTAAL